jgi:cytochrome c
MVALDVNQPGTSPYLYTDCHGQRLLETMSMNVLHMRLHASIAWALAAAFSSLAFAESEPTNLINQQHCMFCHTVDVPFLAPSFHQIADRYRGEPAAGEMLERKLRLGGKTHWGDTPMPPSSERGGPLSRQDAHVLVDWVLSQ